MTSPGTSAPKPRGLLSIGTTITSDHTLVLSVRMIDRAGRLSVAATGAAVERLAEMMRPIASSLRMAPPTPGIANVYIGAHTAMQPMLARARFAAAEVTSKVEGAVIAALGWA